MSSGEYRLKNLKLDRCNDKGVSVGESSNVEIVELTSSNTKTAVAVKDSSVTKITNLSGNDNKYCIQIYKKTGVWTSKLSILNNLCQGEMVILFKKVRFMKAEERKEYKFILNSQSKSKQLFFIRKDTKIHPSRKITSLYFDTIDFKI